MKDDLEMESLLKEMRLQSLPADLQERMAEPPPRRARWNRVLAPGLLAAAAVWIVMLVLPDRSPESGGAQGPVTVLERQSSLVDKRVVAIIQGEGQAWELSDQEWLDEEIAICSTSSMQVRLTTTRRELVCEPIPYL